MSKTILEIALSVDGYVAGPHDEQDWLEQFDDLSEFGFEDFISGIGAIVMGMRSYELGVKHGWFKNNTYGPSPIFVICTDMPSHPSADADFRFVTGGVTAVYEQAVAAAGDKNVYVFGGPNIVQQFLDADLLDEMRLNVVPVILGQGILLFANMAQRRIRLECMDVKTFSKGLIRLHYKIVK